MSLHFGSIASPGLAPHDFSRNAVTLGRPRRRVPSWLRLDLRRSLQLHRGWLFGLSGIGLVAALIYLVSFWSSYKAASFISIEPSPVRESANASPLTYGSDAASFDSYVQQQVSSVTRSELLQSAVRRLAPGVWRLRGESEEGAANRLNEAIAVSRVAGNSQIAITARASDADTAAALANAVAQSYLEEMWRQQLNAPVEAHLASAAVAPPYGVNTPVLRNAATTLLGFVFFGVLAAIVAFKFDRNIYVAADVEAALGAEPIALLPDFTEVTVEVAEEHLLCLAAEIDFACSEGRLKNCIFTGTGPGAGTTTIASRVRDTLESMGRRTVLIDATGPLREEPNFESRIDDMLAEGLRFEELHSSLVEKTNEARPEGAHSRLVLTDTPPISVSADTEYLTRYADCLMVVVASGETTRAQLNRVADLVQRVNPRIVGFVLNRISLAKADAAFRHSIEETERHRRTQGRPTSLQAIRNKYFVAESVRAAAAKGIAPQTISSPLDLNSGATVGNASPIASPRGSSGMAENATDSSQINWDPENMPHWLNDAMARIEEAHLNGKRLPLELNLPELHPQAVAPQPDSPLADPIEQADSQGISALTSKSAIEAILQEQLDSEGQKLTATEKSTGEIGSQRAPQDSILNPVEWIVGNPPKSSVGASGASVTDVLPSEHSRLNHLRGIVPAHGLRELDETRSAAAAAGEAPSIGGAKAYPSTSGYAKSEGSGSRLSLLRGLASSDTLKELQQARHRLPLDEIGSPAPTTFVERATPTVEQKNDTPAASAQSPFDQPLQDSSLTGAGRSAGTIDELLPSEAEEKSPLQMRDEKKQFRNLPHDDVQILPARRGQYQKSE